MLSPSGNPITGKAGYPNGGLDSSAYAIALDRAGNAWVTIEDQNSLVEFSHSGTPLSGGSGFSGGGLYAPDAVAIDGSGSVWAANQGGNSVSKFASSGTAILGSPYKGGNMNVPNGIAIDGSGNVWVANTNNSVTELLGAGTPVITPICAGLPVTPTRNGTSQLGTRP